MSIDARPPGDPKPCPRGRIPALDGPKLTAARDGDWYPDGAIVFGVIVGGDVVAFPRNIMGVHEMVNITIGGRWPGIPYCTLRASAPALADGRNVTLRGVRPLVDGDGLRAGDGTGRSFVAHEAFWFAWSRFHQATAVWIP